jgi:hypothetical protein
VEYVHITFQYARGTCVDCGPPNGRGIVLKQRYTQRDVLPPLYAYLVEFSTGDTTWRLWIDAPDIVGRVPAAARQAHAGVDQEQA